MRINLVCVEDSIMAFGVRKMGSFTKSINPDTQLFFVPYMVNRSNLRVLLGTFGNIKKDGFDGEEIHRMAEPLAKGDIVGFSSMTGYSDQTRALIQEVRRINPQAFILWGGIHPIIHPEDAIKSADAICTGEGEYAFEELISAFKDGRDFTGIKNFWFNHKGKVIRNDFRPLNTSADMEQFPFTQYGEGELLYQKDKGFNPLTTSDYLKFNGTAYYTIWSIGCPYRCSYCGNTKFIDNDPSYRKLRHPSVEYILNEVKYVQSKYPFISSAIFYDDSFMAIPKNVLLEFAKAWTKEIDMPFCVKGVIPSFVKEEKMEILVHGGMNRLRMGIQSGSDRILDFYQRPNKPGLIPKTVSIIASFSDYMIPPAYDIIVDNPIETKEDVLATLELLYNMERPFTVDVFSLRVIPNTEMEKKLREHEISMEEISSNYLRNAPTFANCLVYLLTVFRPPRPIFDYLLRFVKPYSEKQPHFPILFLICRILWLGKRTFYHIRFMDFSTIPGRAGWLFWKLGIIKFWRKNILKQSGFKKGLNLGLGKHLKTT